ncbi:hypothetical protein V5O48_008758 [Marasmius crinis-equi]|uniref:Succinate dehydrogenase assembly factor 4, mitochondrial n=1 Tax=Marasmius crinis-equi TaxID=585013 RepID=A0ABR3FD24_9AGAR
MLARFVFRPSVSRVSSRTYANNWNRPSPPPLPKEQQQEFEELQRVAQAPLASSTAHATEAELSMHPDARKPLKPSFEGDVNPVTGEEGGPKHEPVGKWGDEGDWSFKGRVSDF